MHLAEVKTIESLVFVILDGTGPTLNRFAFFTPCIRFDSFKKRPSRFRPNTENQRHTAHLYKL